MPKQQKKKTKVPPAHMGYCVAHPFSPSRSDSLYSVRPVVPSRPVPVLSSPCLGARAKKISVASSVSVILDVVFEVGCEYVCYVGMW